MNSVNKGTQILLSLKYKELLHTGISLPKFEDVEFRNFSQNGEDGILLYIFSLIGITNKKSVEICAGNGIECNTANLIINHGWHGLLVDGLEENINIAKEFYSNHKDTWLFPPVIKKEWVTIENVNSLIIESGFKGDIDLLSIDLDSTDYWIWNAIQCISPRVVVVEYNNLWGSDKAVTIPYNPHFKVEYNEYGADYHGASLAAFVKLAKKKGYRLVGCHKWGFNAFFIKSGIGENILPEVSTAECLSHPYCTFSNQQRLPKVIQREWIDV